MKNVLPLLLILLATDSVVLGQRSKDRLLAFYDFEEGAGTSVLDSAGFGDPLNLTIHDPSAVTWGNGFLSLEDDTVVSSASAENVPSEGTAMKLFSAIGGDSGSGSITIETWVTPAEFDKGGPARIVTMSFDPTNRNFTLGQNVENYQARFRTTSAGNNGSDIRRESDLGVDTVLTHLVYTRDPSGDAFIYIDGDESPLLPGNQSSGPLTGEVTNWNETYDFAIGNELTWAVDDIAVRSFLGEFHMVAIYGRPLSADEVKAHFDLGKDAAQGLLVPGDFNDDGALDMADFIILSENFGEGTTFDQGDANGDGTVDLRDFVVFRDAFNSVQGQAASVPEPSAITLLWTALLPLSLLGRSRRKA